MHANDPYDRITGRGWILGEGDPALGCQDRSAAPLHQPCRGKECSGADPVLTPHRKLRFLDELSQHGNVRVAAARIGVSRSGLYLARRRDAEFAQGWRSALVLARDHVEAVLAERALDGVEEQVFYHGEVVAVRRRFDTRLLLAHLARLDMLCADEAAAVSAEDERVIAAQFDRDLARIGELPEADALEDATSHDEARQQAYWAAQASGRGKKAAEAEMDAAGDEWEAAQTALFAAVDAVSRGAGAMAREDAAQEVLPLLEFKSLGGPAFRSSGTVSSLSSAADRDNQAGAIRPSDSGAFRRLRGSCGSARHSSPPGRGKSAARWNNPPARH
ncbi:MAG: hypothetical protein ACKOPM_15895 [Novosphingobium sp.]